MAATRAYAASTTIATNTNTYTYNSHAIGTAAADRYVVVGYHAVHTLTDAVVNSITLGGNNMTEIRQDKTNQAVDAYTGLFIRAEASGTTANIVVSWSQTMSNCTISVWALYGIDGTEFHDNGDNTGASTATSVSTTLNIASGGVAVAVAIGTANNAAHTATGLTEDYDANTETNGRAHAMSAQSMSVETGRTITSTGTAVTVRCISAASWQESSSGAMLLRGGKLLQSKMVGGRLAYSGRPKFVPVRYEPLRGSLHEGLR
jgi:hypothetical protein